MFRIQILNFSLSMVIGVVCLGTFPTTIVAQSLESQLSSPETYVGQPVLLQIQISDAKEIDSPQLPKIDGLELALVGTPARSSQVSIINGRRSESSSVLFNYQIIARRPGTYKIPPIQILIDGREKFTPEYQLVVTVSETGDLMFAKISGQDKPVYVGQPVKITLQIWLKPFVDSARKIKLSEANMWQLLAPSSNWGPFQKRLEELLGNNQRPAGKMVSRKNDAGELAEYYLYEIESTVYPQRPGQLQVGDVQVVANYPTELGESRNQLSIFDDDDDFGSSLMREFFSDSSRNRKSLVVKATRPIAASADRSSLEVIDVPTLGRPADYRGAVGKYRFVTQAQPTDVTAGAPITLQMIFQGDGPMELVQAPPLATLASLTDDFKVADDSLAGIVQNDAKLFTTTIRPRREGIKTIPPIPFTFFNPESEQFETISSEPISIQVGPADVLALDSIVANTSANDRAPESPDQSKDIAQSNFTKQLNLTNDTTETILGNASQRRSFNWLIIATPPLLWVMMLIMTRRRSIKNFFAARRPVPKALSAIRRANSPGEVALAIQELYGTSMPPAISDVIQRCQQSAYSLLESVSTNELKTAASAAIREDLREQAKTRKEHPRALLMRLIGWLFLGVLALGSSDSSVVFGQAPGRALNVDQQRTILNEANELYARATELKSSDVAAAHEQFSAAIDKYQTVAAAGIRSPELMSNVGNAYLQINEVGRAIASFEQALRWNPYQFRVVQNLVFARGQLESTPGARVIRDWNWRLPVSRMVELNRLIPARWVWWIAVVSWVTIWAVIGWRLLFPPPRFFGLLICSSVLLVLATLSLSFSNNLFFAADGVTLNRSTEMRLADDSNFPVVGSLSIGESVKLLDERGGWIRVQPLDKSESGWIPREHVFLFALDSKR